MNKKKSRKTQRGADKKNRKTYAGTLEPLSPTAEYSQNFHCYCSKCGYHCCYWCYWHLSLRYFCWGSSSCLCCCYCCCCHCVCCVGAVWSLSRDFPKYQERRNYGAIVVCLSPKRRQSKIQESSLLFCRHFWSAPKTRR